MVIFHSYIYLKLPKGSKGYPSSTPNPENQGPHIQTSREVLQGLARGARDRVATEEVEEALEASTGC